MGTDIVQKNAAQMTMVTGSDGDGKELTPVKSTGSGDLNSTDIINTGGVEGEISVPNTAVEAKIGASALTDRKLLVIFNSGTGIIYWGYRNTITVSGSTAGMPIFKKEKIGIPVGPNQAVYLISNSASGNSARITEGA